MKRMILYFGSFNPIHCGHIALAEYAIERDLCDEVIMVVSPQNPLKSSRELAPELERFAMTEVACAESKYPDRIKPSAIEFMLPKPSYTIDTLQYLSENFGAQMHFSILMGGDLVEQLPRWKNYEQILDNYTIYLYPRPNESVERFRDRMIYLADAPQFEISSSEVRRRLILGDDTAGMISPAVAKHIESVGLWSAKSVADYMERAKWHYKHARWGDAINALNKVLRMEPNNTEAREMARMAREILDFRYTDIYNP